MKLYQAIFDYLSFEASNSFIDDEEYSHMISQCLFLCKYPIAHVKVAELTLDDYRSYILTLMKEGYDEKTINDQSLLLTDWIS